MILGELEAAWFKGARKTGRGFRSQHLVDAQRRRIRGLLHLAGRRRKRQQNERAAHVGRLLQREPEGVARDVQAGVLLEEALGLARE